MDTLEKDILSLPNREMQVLFLRCQDLELHPITDRMQKSGQKISYKTVQSIGTKLYEHLHIADLPKDDKVPYLIKNAKPILDKLNIKTWEDALNWEPQDTQAESDIPQEISEPKIPKKDIPQDTSERETSQDTVRGVPTRNGGRRRGVIQFIAGILTSCIGLVLLLVVANFVFRITPRLIPPRPTNTPTQTDTPLPAAVLRLSETATLTPTITETPVPSDTPLPSDTPPPTNTPLPTQTPLPSPTPQMNIFKEEFKGKINDAWDISNDEYKIDGDFFYPRSNAIRAVVGDASWSNYVVTVNIADLYTRFGAGFEIVVRWQDDANYMALIMNSLHRCQMRWLIVQNGSETIVNNATLAITEGCVEGSWRVEVKGDTFKTFKDLALHYEFNDSTFPTGKVGFRMTAKYDNAKIDNFIVELLP